MDDAAADDVELVRRFQRGDAAAFALFVRRHQDAVFRFARPLLRRPEDAQDVAQEVFLRALRGLHGFRFLAAPKTWLLKVVRNVCREHNRRWRRHEDVDRLTQRDDPALAVIAAGDDDDSARLQQAIAALPARQREVVILRMFEDLSVRETAQVMGCREGTVKAHLNKAVGNLRDLFGVVDEARDAGG